MLGVLAGPDSDSCSSSKNPFIQSQRNELFWLHRWVFLSPICLHWEFALFRCSQNFTRGGVWWIGFASQWLVNLDTFTKCSCNAHPYVIIEAGNAYLIGLLLGLNEVKYVKCLVQGLISSVQFSRSVVSNSLRPHGLQGVPPGLPIHHQLLELAQTHVHWVGDAIQPSRPLSSPSPPTLLMESI